LGESSHALLVAVVRKPEMELQTALDRLIASGLLFRQGALPYASYLFKHALIQDAASVKTVLLTHFGLSRKSSGPQSHGREVRLTGRFG
jgi:hypothetical protein